MTKEQWLVVQCLMLYWYNVSHTDKAFALFPAAIERYLLEKIDQMASKGLDGFWGILDHAKQMKLIELACIRYKGEVSMSLAALSEYQIDDIAEGN